MMKNKKIFIYYSLSGNGDVVADHLLKQGFVIRKVITKEPLPNNRFLQIMTGGYKAMINYQDKLDSFDSNIDEYKEVYIGSPIWNSRLSSPINTVLSNLDLNDKKIKFILYSGSGKDNKATLLLQKKYPKCEIINIKEPKTNQVEFEKVL